jgi:3-methyladenine DNA glycosylase AlkC
MDALMALTEAFSSEFAIRPFLIRYEKKALARLEKWARHENEHVRRLVSEGSRPLLPWGERIPAFVSDPKRTWALLDSLYRDPSEYVRRSVANHVNDHAKNHPEFVLKQLSKWKKSEKLVRHALRTLIKKGDPRALALIGIESGGIDIVDFRLGKKSIRLDEALPATLTLKNTKSKPLRVVVDFEIGLRGSRGQTRTKVFKGKSVTIPARERVVLTLSQKLRTVTTRSYYPGTQTWRVIVNGKRSVAREFTLRTK